MSQIILDDQLADVQVRVQLSRWTTVQRLRDLRPGEVIKDERVATILRELRQPTFITIDTGFWNARLRDAHYCILYFALRSEDQREIPGLLRQLFRFSGFATKAVRMGKVARVSQAQVDYWQLGTEQMQRLAPQGQWQNRLLREQPPMYDVESQVSAVHPAADSL